MSDPDFNRMIRYFKEKEQYNTSLRAMRYLLTGEDSGMPIRDLFKVIPT